MVSTAGLTPGTRLIAASFTGNGNFVDSSATLLQVVRARTTTSVTSSAEPAPYAGVVRLTVAVATDTTTATGTDRTVTYDTTAPMLTLQQAAGQADPTGTASIRFTLTSNEDLSTGSVTSADFSVSGGTVASVDCATVQACTVVVTATTDCSGRSRSYSGEISSSSARRWTVAPAGHLSTAVVIADLR